MVVGGSAGNTFNTIFDEVIKMFVKGCENFFVVVITFVKGGEQ